MVALTCVLVKHQRSC